MEAKIISFYTEYSLDNQPFKPRKDYDIDWDKVVEISKECGMISTEEKVIDNLLIRITKWSRKTSYYEWLSDPLIQEYIMQRDSYNVSHNIINSLSITQTNNGN